MKGAYGGGADLRSRLRLVLGHLSKGFSFIVAPHGTGTTVTFNLPGKVATALLILVIAFAAGLALIGVTYTKLAILALETAKLRTENELLRAENQKINEIEEELVRIEDIRRQIEAWAGVVPGEAAVASVAENLRLAPNVWPRQYTYAIMKPFYAALPRFRQGMIAPAVGWISRRFIAAGDETPPHPGIDIAASAGTPVRCVLDGDVVSAGWDDVYGKLIVVGHGDSLRTAYGHNETILVKEGEHVTKGQVIATIGSTGRSTAPHLHFEVLEEGGPVDPEKYVDFARQ